MPINTAVGVYNQIIKTGHVTRGSIGINYRDDDEQKARIKAYGGKEGVFVMDVTPDSGADRAGLKPEDIITSLDGKPVRNGQDLVEVVSSTPVGSTLNVGVLRNGKQETFKVAVGDRAKLIDNAAAESENTGPGSTEPTNAKFGITIRNLNDNLRTNMGYNGKGGALVDSVEPGSFAEDIGLTKGDVIESMTSNNQRQPIASVDDIQRVQSKLKPGDTVAFKIARNVGGQRGTQWITTYPAGTVPAQ